MAANFNMQEFNEILEKCRDQSQQKKQDQVGVKLKKFPESSLEQDFVFC
jgi:hypothetical protein